MSVEREMIYQMHEDELRQERYDAQKDFRKPEDWDETKGEWKPLPRPKYMSHRLTDEW